MSNIALFKGQKIRRTLHGNEWFFSVIDVISVLTESQNARRYWSDLKIKLEDEEGFSELYEKIVQLKMEAPDGKMRETDCSDTETIFRILQSIPSPKAEPFKHWLAKVGYERIQEIENPELATNGVTPSQYKRLKGLKRKNLRDHMDDFELIFNMLGERATTEIHRTENSKGTPKLKQDAKAGGARKQLEKRLGRSVVSKDNYLDKPEAKKLK